MNRSNQVKEAGNRIIDITKFDVRRYDRCADLDAVNWAWHLSFRCMIRSCMLGPENNQRRMERLGEDFADPIGLLLQIIEDPIKKTHDRPMNGLKTYWSVDDMTSYDMWAAKDMFDAPGLAEAKAQCEQCHSFMTRDEFVPCDKNPDGKLPHESFHSHMLEAGVYSARATDLIPVLVNLGAPDSIIKAQFEEWLAAKRAEVESRGFLKGAPKREFKAADFRKWHENRVLAYIDLDLLSYHMQTPLTDAEIANRLFPNAMFDATEKIRRTVGPLARQIMDADFIRALDAQAAYEWKLKNPAWPEP